MVHKGLVMVRVLGLFLTIVFAGRHHIRILSSKKNSDERLSKVENGILEIRVDVCRRSTPLSCHHFG